MDHAGRLSRLRHTLNDDKLDILLVTHLPNIRYLCGFAGSSSALLVTEGESVLFTDSRYRIQAFEEVVGAKTVIGPKSPPVAAAEWLSAQLQSSRKRSRKGSRPHSLAIEPESTSVAARDRVAAILRGKLRLGSAPPWSSVPVW